ncbi:hypothetical protein J7355_13640 [Endozoicomonas sp. G2_2]|uniref:hypothetical protein n=1 Tax=Endozoicomonas sp. G2_2 TaxID=2821092 RepID=UPI001ADCC7B3|nr:hypothetical protein [Endozoicomonas sp. G2_2]MBO9471136.1 hypothetical protein [Endozoicomonas sp. G2_2]
MELREEEAQQNAYAAQFDALNVAERAVLREKRVFGSTQKSTAVPRLDDDLLEGLDIFKQSVR